MMERVCVIGCGYIGLPTACMFARAGFLVHAVDVNEEVIKKLSSGNVHIEEPGMEDLLAGVIGTGNITFSLEPSEADAFIICVPTMLGPDKRANLEHVKAAANSILPHLKKGCIVILESTVPPGTCTGVVKPILESTGKAVGEDFFLAFCPERVIPGKILIEIVENDRIVGGTSHEGTIKAKKLYASFVTGEIHETDATTAELVKLMENTFRDVNIALANEFSLVGKRLGIDIWEAIQLANKHPRVNIHEPGPGVGGHCIPIVPWFIVEKADDITHMIKVGRGINDSMPKRVVEELNDFIGGAGGKTLTVWGVAFKPNTDDSSFTPATTIIRLLEAEGASVKVHDPFVKHYTCPLLEIEDSVRDSNGIIIVANHDFYKDVDVAALGSLMKEKKLLDTRNSVSTSRWIGHGFDVRVLGKYK